MEALEINNVELYGKQIDKVTFNDKFNIVKSIHDFKKATIKGSWYKNELYLIENTNKGIHDSYSGWRICDLEPVYEEKDIWNYDKNEYETIKVITCYKTVTNDSLEDFVKEHQEEVQQWFDIYIDKKEYEQKLKEKQKWCEDNFKHYYEVEFQQPKQGKIYLENNMSKDSIYIESDKHGVYLENNSICYGSQDESIFQSVIRYIFLNRNIFSDFKQLNEGYVFNNQYYESIEDILSDIEDIIQNKKLCNKFMNEGLTLEDFKEEE